MNRTQQHFRYEAQNSLGKSTKVSELTEAEAKDELCESIEKIADLRGRLEEAESTIAANIEDFRRVKQLCENVSDQLREIK